MAGNAARMARATITGLVLPILPSGLAAGGPSGVGQTAQSGIVEINSDQVWLAAAETSAGDYDSFFAALRNMESSGNYQSINTLNFIGAYQFGEAALIDLGYVRRDSDIYDNNYSGGFTGKNGIHSVRDFINNPEVQDQAAEEWMQIMWRYIRADGLDRYTWHEVGGITLSPSGMLAAAHLLGSGGLRRFVDSNGRADIRDPYGMPLRNYIVELGGYHIPFAPSRPGLL